MQHDPERGAELIREVVGDQEVELLFLLPGVLWLAVKGVLPNGAKPDKISCYKK